MLHQTLSRYNQLALKHNPGYYTASSEIALTYDPDIRAYLVDLGIGKGANYHPVNLYYQPLDSDPDTDQWAPVSIVGNLQFPTESGKEYIVAAFVGNNWNTVDAVYMQLNVTEEFVSERRFRLDYRLFPVDVIDYSERVPFPAEFTDMLETAVAAEGLILANNDSPGWQRFVSLQGPRLEARKMMREREFEDWLSMDVKNTYVREQPYHYLRNNPQLAGRRVNYKVEPQ